MSLYANAKTCKACPSREGAACRHTGIKIGRHAAAGDCPEHRFPASGVITLPVADLAGFDVEEEKRRLKSGGCCGSPSNEAEP